MVVIGSIGCIDSYSRPNRVVITAIVVVVIDVAVVI